MARAEDTYVKAARIADALLAQGLPLTEFVELRYGLDIGMKFRMTSGASAAFIMPGDVASEEAFAAAFRDKDRVPA